MYYTLVVGHITLLVSGPQTVFLVVCVCIIISFLLFLFVHVYMCLFLYNIFIVNEDTNLSVAAANN